MTIRIGNIIRSPHGDLEIVTAVNDYGEHGGTISTVAAWAQQVLSTGYINDRETEETCMCGDHPDFQGAPQEDCEDCKGTGRYKVLRPGYGRSKVVATCMMDFIQKRALKAFKED